MTGSFPQAGEPGRPGHVPRVDRFSGEEECSLARRFPEGGLLLNPVTGIPHCREKHRRGNRKNARRFRDPPCGILAPKILRSQTGLPRMQIRERVHRPGHPGSQPRYPDPRKLPWRGPGSRHYPGRSPGDLTPGKTGRFQPVLSRNPDRKYPDSQVPDSPRILQVRVRGVPGYPGTYPFPGKRVQSIPVNREPVPGAGSTGRCATARSCRVRRV